MLLTEERERNINIFRGLSFRVEFEVYLPMLLSSVR
jgi:hypothetical protein